MREIEKELSRGDYNLNKPQRARQRALPLSRLIFYFPPADLGPQTPPPTPSPGISSVGVGKGWELSPRFAHDPNCPISEMSICPRARPHFSSGRTIISRRSGQPNAPSLLSGASEIREPVRALYLFVRNGSMREMQCFYFKSFSVYIVTYIIYTNRKIY